jgi:SAM-dependent methyltransferase
LATDYVAAPLDDARRRADADGLAVATEIADAEDLPYPDASFDVVLSTFGVMFTPDQDGAAAELVRVCRPGGRIGLASWTPDGFIGELFRVVGRVVRPPAGLRAPTRWGTEPGVRALFGDRVRLVSAERRAFVFRYASADHFVDVLRASDGPTGQAFAAVSTDRGHALAADIAALARRFDRGHDDRLAAASDYLEIVLERRSRAAF